MLLANDDDDREALRQSIERNEAELREAVDDLTNAVKRELAVGRWIAENPLPWLAGAFLAGVWLSRPRP